MRACPALRPRPCDSQSVFCDITSAFRTSLRRRLPGNVPISGLNHAACSLTVYASPERVAPPNATLASSRAPPFAGQVSDLSGSQLVGF